MKKDFRQYLLHDELRIVDIFGIIMNCGSFSQKLANFTPINFIGNWFGTIETEPTILIKLLYYYNTIGSNESCHILKELIQTFGGSVCNTMDVKS